MNDVLNKHEQISALADGELDPQDWAAAVALVSEDEEARACWQLYHLVGDVLRSSELASGWHDGTFVARLGAQLQAEPRAPRCESQQDADSVGIGPFAAPPPVVLVSPAAANDGNFRWKLVAGLASMVAVVVMGWHALGTVNPEVSAQLAQSAPGVSLVAMEVPSALGASSAGSAAMMIRDPRLDELLDAHHQFGGTSALQNPSGFLRNATFESPAR